MELLRKLEHWVLGRVKNAPHLPVKAQKWLGQNVWWIVLIGVVLGAISLLFAIGGLLVLASLIGAVSSTYYVLGGPTAWTVVASFIGLLFSVGIVLLNALAIQPLKKMQKKGWVLLFLSWLVAIVSIVVNGILSLNPFSFIFGILFGAIFVAVAGYFLFEIHGQFNHDKPVKQSTKKTTAKTKKA
jgi:hypothetical protein